MGEITGAGGPVGPESGLGWGGGIEGSRVGRPRLCAGRHRCRILSVAGIGTLESESESESGSPTMARAASRDRRGVNSISMQIIGTWQPGRRTRRGLARDAKPGCRQATDSPNMLSRA